MCKACVAPDDLIVISYRIPEGKRVVEAYVRVETFWVEAYRTIEEFDFELSDVDLYIDAAARPTWASPTMAARSR